MLVQGLLGWLSSPQDGQKTVRHAGHLAWVPMLPAASAVPSMSRYSAGDWTTVSGSEEPSPDIVAKDLNSAGDCRPAKLARTMGSLEESQEDSEVECFDKRGKVRPVGLEGFVGSDWDGTLVSGFSELGLKQGRFLELFGVLLSGETIDGILLRVAWE